ncbi:MAG: hypothetical protein H6922_01435 [Pseudomonadaceae bacterium]|nr:hypothetical protein [Pseudomonadaceae bacterium]
MTCSLWCVLLVAVLVSGCTTGLAMRAMNGVGACPPDALRTAQENYGMLQSVRVGEGADRLQGLVAEREMVLHLRTGEVVKAELYRTGHPQCRNMPTEEDFTPVLVNELGLVSGMGNIAFAQTRARASRVEEVGAVAQQDSGWGFGDVMKAVLF